MKIPDGVVHLFCNVEEAEAELQEELIELQNNEEFRLNFRNGYHQFATNSITSSSVGGFGKASYRLSIVILSTQCSY
ncbi:LOW QUALITY PROTEIN: hypothetical protein M514_00520 [Trichuris suis]|uniref:Uncharacterized protein n=1 Tax=Trichuris suis TaxID=68888 RepID=A0A085NRM1_9BILA|nr:LOW QUALITY PROTEIN: hypothetical protein M513_00520 [Trichuris suis]KFD72117.1 LOW QUALITY PROTEIN: hypothetical protein M514_00520 [Trichuris suis]